MSLIAKLSGSPSSWVSSCWIKSTLTSCCIIFPILTILWQLWKYFFRKWWKSLFFTRFFVVPLLLFNMKLSTSLKCLLPIQRSLIRLLRFYWWTNKKWSIISRIFWKKEVCSGFDAFVCIRWWAIQWGEESADCYVGTIRNSQQVIEFWYFGNFFFVFASDLFVYFSLHLICNVRQYLKYSCFFFFYDVGKILISIYWIVLLIRIKQIKRIDIVWMEKRKDVFRILHFLFFSERRMVFYMNCSVRLKQIGGTVWMLWGGEVSVLSN